MTAASRYDQLLLRYGEWLVRRPWQVLLLSLVSVVVLASGARLLTFSTDFRVFFGPDNPQLQAFDELQDTYGNSDNSFIAIAAKSGNVFEPRVLEAVRQLTAEAWNLPYTRRVDSLTNYNHSSSDGDTIKVEPLLPEGAELSAERIAWMRDVALHEPLLLNRFISPRGHVTAMNVYTDLPPDSLRALPEHVRAVRELCERIKAQFPEVQTYLYGVNFAANAQGEAALHDMQTLVPLGLAMFAVICLMLLRSVSGAGATLLIVGFSSATAIGLAGFAGVVITPPSATAPTIITTLAIADSVHFCVAMFAAMREGLERRAAAVHALHKNFTPIFLTSITTAVGFLSINFTDSPPLRDLGNITAAGVMLAWFYSMFLLPALMCLLPLKVPAGRRSPLEDGMARLAEFVLARRKPVFAGVALTTLVLSACMFLNETDDPFHRFYDESVQFRQDSDFILENLSVSYPMDFSLSSGRAEGISDPEYLRQVDAFVSWLKQQPEVSFVGSVSEILKRLNRNLHNDDPAWERLPDTREEAAQFLLLYEISLPSGQDLGDLVSADKSSTRLTVFGTNTGTRGIRELAERAEAWLHEHAPDMRTHATSMPVMFAYISERNIQSMFTQIPLALGAIILLLIPALRSFKFGLLALVPLVFPVMVAFGIWGLMDGVVNFTMAVVIGAVTGIVDDDAVHFLNEYLRGRRDHGLSPEDAIRHTFRTVGAALTVMTAVLVSGILVLTLSAFLPNSGNAKLMALAISAALVFDLLLLPVLILMVDRGEAGSLAFGSDSTDRSQILA